MGYAVELSGENCVQMGGALLIDDHLYLVNLTIKIQMKNSMWQEAQQTGQITELLLDQIQVDPNRIQK